MLNLRDSRVIDILERNYIPNARDSGGFADAAVYEIVVRVLWKKYPEVEDYDGLTKAVWTDRVNSSSCVRPVQI
jgi:hypothetical protein